METKRLEITTERSYYISSYKCYSSWEELFKQLITCNEALLGEPINLQFRTGCDSEVYLDVKYRREESDLEYAKRCALIDTILIEEKSRKQATQECLEKHERKILKALQEKYTNKGK